MQLRTIKLSRRLTNILNIIISVLVFLMMIVVNNEVEGGTYYNGKWEIVDGVSKQMSMTFDSQGEGGSYLHQVMTLSFQWLFNNGQSLRWIILGLSFGVLIISIISATRSIIRKRGSSAVIAPFIIIWQLAVCFIFTGVTITSVYIDRGSIGSLSLLGYVNVLLTFMSIVLNFVMNRYFDHARKEYADKLQHEKFRDKSIIEEPDEDLKRSRSRSSSAPAQVDSTKPQGRGIPINAGGNEIFLNISLADVLNANGVNANAGYRPAAAPVNAQQVNDARGNNDDDEPSNSPYGRASATSGNRQRLSNDAAVNSLLAPSAVHAPGGRNGGQGRNAGRDALAELNAKDKRSETTLRFQRQNNEPEEEKKEDAKPVNAQVDLSTFGIDVSTIKTEEDYKAALEKILQGNLQPLVKEEDDDDTPDPNDSDLDYELQQIEDSDLNDDEIRELKLIIGDPDNKTFIQKFELADEDLRKKYLRLRYILLSSKEKKCTSRITRYFDTYYWHNKIVARISIQGKTIKLFLALDPAAYKDKKISISDESAKLIYRNCPTLIRVRTDISYKNGKKLVADMLGTREADMYTPPVLEFKEKQVDLNYVKPATPEPVVETAPVNEVKPQEAQPVEETKPAAEENNEASFTVTRVENPEESKRVEPDLPDIDENEPTTIIKHKEEPKAEDDGGFDMEIDEFGNEIKHESPVAEKADEDEFEEPAEEEESEDESLDEDLGEDSSEESDMFDDSDDEDSDDSDDEDGDGDDEDEDGESKPKANPFAPRGDGLSSSNAPRKTFAEKICDNEDPLMADHYNELKTFLCSYGVKGRVAKSNESFRFKKELFAKFTVQGKTLKVFLAIDPERYLKSKIPVKDMSKKRAYAEVPCMVKVRSNLSMKRCKQVIEEMMAEKGLLQKDVAQLDYVELLQIGLNHDSKY